MSGLRERARTTIHMYFWLKPRRLAGRAYRYIAIAGARSGLAYFTAELVRRDGLVRIEDPVAGGLLIRLRTSDISVAAKILLEREYELPLRRTPAVIVDAGAYTGISSRWLAGRFPNARVVALEPDPDNFELLERNVRGVSRIEPLHEALWLVDEPLYVSVPDAGAWASEVGRTGQVDRRVEGVSPITLMRRLGLESIDLLKLDVEGAEYELFSDGTDAWLPRVRAIAVEVHDDLRPGSRAALLAACRDFSVREVGSETIFLERA